VYINISDRMSIYLNQTVTWSAKSGQDKYNKITYSDSSISARKEGRRRMVRNLQGEEVVSETTIYTQSAIGAEDKIDGELVIRVNDWIDFNGSVVGYEVYI